MKKAELVEALEKGRQQFLQTIEGLDEASLTQTGVVGHWSIKDVMAHLSMDEAEIVKMLYQAREGTKPTTSQFQNIQVDQQNAEWYEQTKDRTLDQVQRDFLAVRKQTLRRVAAFTDAELDQKGYFPWLKKASLSDIILDDTVIHEEDHRQQLAQWRQESKKRPLAGLDK
jgi:hypothetical protein